MTSRTEICATFEGKSSKCAFGEIGGDCETNVQSPKAAFNWKFAGLESDSNLNWGNYSELGEMKNLLHQNVEIKTGKSGFFEDLFSEQLPPKSAAGRAEGIFANETLGKRSSPPGEGTGNFISPVWVFPKRGKRPSERKSVRAPPNLGDLELRIFKWD